MNLWYRSILDDMIEGCQILTPNWTYLYVNRAAAAQGQRSIEELLGRSMLACYPGIETTPLFETLVRVMEQGAPARFENRFHYPDGTARWFDLLAQRVPEGVFICSIDITERVEADARNREIAKLIDVASDAVAVLSPAGRIRLWNASAAACYGFRSSEAVGKDIGALLQPGVRVRDWTGAVNAALRYGTWSGEIPHMTKDQREIVADTRLTLVRDADGEPERILAVMTDVSEKKFVEAQLLRSQRLESLGALAGGIAHDLNNMLTPVLSGIEVLRMRDADAFSANILEVMSKATRRGARIVGQILAFARGVEGERSEIQPRHLANEVVQIIRETFPRTIEIDGDIPENLRTIKADATQIQQVLMNLCVNARDAMPAGGTLTIRAENVLLDEAYARIHLDARPIQYVLIEIIDTGMGMPPLVKEHIFDPFFTTKEPGKGTGLGLSTSLTILKSHGGFISVYSEVGRGSSFKVYLPALSDAEIAEDRDAPEAKVHGDGELILIADDDDAVLEVSRHVLEESGFRVVTARNGAEAVGAFAKRQNEVRALIVDLQMPIMDGRATARAVRSIDPRAKIIAASGLGAGESNGDARSVEADAYIAKPFTAERLLTTLARVLDYEADAR